MDKIKIKPLKGIIYLKLEEAHAGALVTTSRESAVEFAEVLAVGEGVIQCKKGDKVFVKSWAIDIISHNDQKYYFCNQDTGGLIALVS